jgi:hypothetical protein
MYPRLWSCDPDRLCRSGEPLFFGIGIGVGIGIDQLFQKSDTDSDPELVQASMFLAPP